MPPLPADSIHARACKLKCEKILTRPPTRNRAIDWKLLIAGKENLDYLCVNNFLIK